MHSSKLFGFINDHPIVSLCIVFTGLFLGAMGYVNLVYEVTMPACIGLETKRAIILLQGAGLGEPHIEAVYDRSVQAGTIRLQDPPAGRSVRRGRHVYLQVSRGGRVVLVPTLQGLSIYQAQERLAQQGLKEGKREYDDSKLYEVNVVLAQDPLPGVSTLEGSAVRLKISRQINPHVGSLQ